MYYVIKENDDNTVVEFLCDNNINFECHATPNVPFINYYGNKLNEQENSPIFRKLDDRELLEADCVSIVNHILPEIEEYINDWVDAIENPSNCDAFNKKYNIDEE